MVHRRGDFRFKAGDAMLSAPEGALVFRLRETPHCFEQSRRRRRAGSWQATVTSGGRLEPDRRQGGRDSLGISWACAAARSWACAGPISTSTPTPGRRRSRRRRTAPLPEPFRNNNVRRAAARSVELFGVVLRVSRVSICPSRCGVGALVWLHVGFHGAGCRALVAYSKELRRSGPG